MPAPLNPVMRASVCALIVLRASATVTDNATAVDPAIDTATPALPTPAYRSDKFTALTVMPFAWVLCAVELPLISARTLDDPLFVADEPAPAADKPNPPVPATATESAITSARIRCVESAVTLKAPFNVTSLSITRETTANPLPAGTPLGRPLMPVVSLTAMATPTEKAAPLSLSATATATPTTTVLIVADDSD